MKYDPKEYEPVKLRKERFYKDHPDGRITVKLLSIPNIMEYAVFMASVYLNREDQINKCPRGIGYATEIRDKDKSVSNYGKEYESVNYTSWTENSEESAVGRALDNAGYSGNRKCSLEEMQKSERMSTVTSPTPPKQTTVAKPTTSTDYGKCSRCGAPNKWSTNKNKAYCGAMCWNNPKPVPDKIVEDEITDKVMDEISEMPF